jgi:hypothetical protein
MGRMYRVRVSAFAAALSLAQTPVAAVAERAGSYPCYWVRGRMLAYNGNPTFRIWPRGTNRLLGVVGDDPGSAEDPPLPATLRRILEPNAFEHEIWANFRVCPVEPEHEGRMRMVVVRDADVLAVRDYGTSHR